MSLTETLILYAIVLSAIVNFALLMRALIMGHETTGHETTEDRRVKGLLLAHASALGFSFRDWRSAPKYLQHHGQRLIAVGHVDGFCAEMALSPPREKQGSTAIGLRSMTPLGAHVFLVQRDCPWPDSPPFNPLGDRFVVYGSDGDLARVLTPDVQGMLFSFPREINVLSIGGSYAEMTWRGVEEDVELVRHAFCWLVRMCELADQSARIRTVR